jgi:GNAT superfamily N-acetyltransferase
LLRPPLESDARHVASLLSQLGYPSDEADVRIRLRRFLDREDCFFRVAHSADSVIGLVNADLIPNFPNGSMICRVTSLFVSEQNRSRGIGEQLLAAAAIFESVSRRCRIFSGFSSRRRCTASRMSSCSHRVTRRALPVVQLCLMAQLWQALVE